jgi:hypothetical protein
MIVPKVLLYRRIHSSNLSYQAQVGDPMLLSALRASIRRKRKQQPAK